MRIQDDLSLEKRLWGTDAEADETAISREFALTQGAPDAIRYLIPAALFAGRMFRWNMYDSGKWRLKNLEGVLLNQYFKRVGLASAGVGAAECFTEITDGPDIPPDPVEHGMVCYNAASAWYSLLHQARSAPGLHPEQVCGIAQRLGLRAIEIYANPAMNADLGRLQIARLWYLLGDLARALIPDQSDLRESIACYDRAMAVPIPDDLRSYIEEAKRNASRQLHGFTGRRESADRLPVDYAADDWAVLSARERCNWYQNAAIQLEEDGTLTAAEEALHLAADLALIDLETAPDPGVLRLDARAYNALFADLARVNVALGRPRPALEAIETIRAGVLRRADNPSAEDDRERAKTIITKSVLDLVGKRPEAPRLSRLRGTVLTDRATPGVDRALDELSRCGWPEDIDVCSFTMSSQTVSSIIARREKGAWLLDGTHWAADTGVLLRGFELLDLDPSIFRERRLYSYCALMSTVLVEGILPVLRRLEIRRVAVSAPGLFSHVPFEALPTDSGVIADEFEVFYIPSLRMAASMAGALAPESKAQRILIFPYHGPDLRDSATEVARIADLYQGRADIADLAAPKRDLIGQLHEGDYDIVHFACHGTFDLADESRSAICLTAGDGHTRLLEAHELTKARFSGAPLVVLSACETGLSSLSLTSDYIGLTGSFLRMGARGIIGSRWAVYDDAALAFMDRLYCSLADGTSTEHAVAAAQSMLRSTSGAEDWAAFSYLGLPALQAAREA